MTFPPRGKTAEDEGQASLFLILGLTFSIFALMLLFIRLGNANDFRSQAQTAADAAALAAVGNTQDRMAKALAAGGLIHFSAWNEESGEAAASKYAKSNKGVLSDIRASDNYLGYSGNHVRVVVRGALCQRELKDDRSRRWSETQCDGTEKKKKIDTFSGEAAAIARIDMPNCTLVNLGTEATPYYRPSCNGRVIYNEADARAEINVQLVDDEGKYIYDPIAAGDFEGDNSGLAGGSMGPCDAPGADNTTPLMCATHKAIMKEFTFPKGVGCYRADGGIVVGEHPKGRACDYMVSSGMPTPDQEALGDALSAWIQQHADKLGVKYIIWKQRIWHPNRGGWEPMNDRGSITENHYDHVHLSVN